jgi:integrase
MKRVGLRWIGWHSFRRGIASTLFLLGASDMIVMKVLRHSRVSVTRDRYGKIQDLAVQAAMDVFSRSVTERAANAGRAVVGEKIVSH